MEVQRAKPPSWLGSALLIVSAMAGVGLLGLPRALAHTGWLGLVVLALCALFSYITTGHYLRILLASIDPDWVGVIDYSVLGYQAFGQAGGVLAHITQNTTLIGSSIIYLVVVGHMLHTLTPVVPAPAYSSVAGVLLCVFVCFVPSLRKVRWNAYLAVSSTCLVAVLILGMLLVAEVPEPELVNFDYSGLAYTFAVFTYAFGGHSIHPSIFAITGNMGVWRKATLFAFPVTALLLYMPVAAVSYRVFGRSLIAVDSVFEALDGTLPPGFAPLYVVAVVAMTLHVVMTLPIIFIPVLQRLEASVIGHCCAQPRVVELHSMELSERPANCCTANRAMRIVVTLAITLLAALLPYVTELMAIVASLSIACDVYIFPSLFYLQRTNQSVSWASKALAWLIVLFGLVGATAGLAKAIPALAAKITDDTAFSSGSSSS